MDAKAMNLDKEQGTILDSYYKPQRHIRGMLSSFSFKSLALGFGAVYISLSYIFYHLSAGDPTSLFFNPETAYSPGYTSLRRTEAERFITDLDRSDSTFLSRSHNESRSHILPSDTPSTRRICVGIPSVAREGIDYLETTVGSLLAGLHPEERDDIHLVVLLANSDPGLHRAYHNNWTHSLVDELLVYDLSAEELDHIKTIETSRGSSREKGLFDYVYVLKACRAHDNAYVAMLEDDVIALDGWYHRTISALQEAEQKTAARKRDSDFLYLRLFYTEEFLGWNSEDWPTYLSWSIIVVTMSAAILLLLRARYPSTRNILNNHALLTICGVFLPLLIGLYFAAGKVTVMPMPNGVNEMNNYGCCSQGLVFPRSKVDELILWFESKRVGFVDMLTEELADINGELRWALTPSVLQHVGRKSSKGDDYGVGSKYHMSVAEKLWNFTFERNKMEELKSEHLWTI